MGILLRDWERSCELRSELLDLLVVAHVACTWNVAELLGEGQVLVRRKHRRLSGVGHMNGIGCMHRQLFVEAHFVSHLYN